MRIEMVRGMTNVLRFPVERRSKPTLDLLREIAPDPREVWQVMEAFDLERLPHELRPAADRAMAEHIAIHVSSERGEKRRAALREMLAPLVARAVDACRRTDDAMGVVAAAQERLVNAQAEGGYWIQPLEEEATARTNAAARLLVEAYVAAEEAEGAARAIGMAMRGEEWRPFDLQAEAEALFFGTERRSA